MDIILGICKTCTKCGMDKPLSEFYKSKTEKYGHTARCKICTSVIRKERYSIHSEYVKKNPDKWKEYRREYWKKRRAEDAKYRFGMSRTLEIKVDHLPSMYPWNFITRFIDRRCSRVRDGIMNDMDRPHL